MANFLFDSCGERDLCPTVLSFIAFLFFSKEEKKKIHRVEQLTKLFVWFGLFVMWM